MKFKGSLRGKKGQESDKFGRIQMQRSCCNSWTYLIVSIIIITTSTIIISTLSTMHITSSTFLRGLNSLARFRSRSRVLPPSTPLKMSLPTVGVRQPYNTSRYVLEILKSVISLRKHPFYYSLDSSIRRKSLDKVMEYLFTQQHCQNKPLFITMANVMSSLYWQMIENYMFTLEKYDLNTCALVICVSDEDCMKQCDESSFPCYYYDYKLYHPNKELPSAMEQIATLKLQQIPLALERGVDIVIVDLDVGFLSDPMLLLKEYKSHKHIDVFVQEDVTFIMDRSKEHWKNWYTEPLPNIGLMLCRGNKKTVKMFSIAWHEYKKSKPEIRMNPGKDQNKVVEAMVKMKKLGHLKWKYLNKNAAVLLDKIFKFTDQTFELGGQAALEILDPDIVIAAHTTCYEQKVKVMALKAVNAFWNPKYYDPNRRTITKKLIYTGVATDQLINEVRSLVYLSIVTKRSLILPNILGDETAIDETVQLYKGKALWPGFRILYMEENAIDYPLSLVEPSYYWRIRTMTSYGDMIPEPTIVCIPSGNANKLTNIESLLLSTDYHDKNRIVLHVSNNCQDRDDKSIISWADDSVGRFDSYPNEVKAYEFLPTIKESLIGHGEIILGGLSDSELGKTVLDSTRLCAKIFERARGNRSCFDKCD